jgi:hypothetical protein
MRRQDGGQQTGETLFHLAVPEPTDMRYRQFTFSPVTSRPLATSITCHSR